MNDEERYLLRRKYAPNGQIRQLQTCDIRSHTCSPEWFASAAKMKDEWRMGPDFCRKDGVDLIGAPKTHEETKKSTVSRKPKQSSLVVIQ